MKRLMLILALGLVIYMFSGCAGLSKTTIISFDKKGQMIDKDGKTVHKQTVWGRAIIVTPPDENGNVFYIDTSHPTLHSVMSVDKDGKMTQKMSFPIGSSRYNQWLGGFGYQWGFNRNLWNKHNRKRWR